MQSIPRVFHYVWVGDRPLPGDLARCQRSWLDRHPTWTMRVWTETSLPPDLTRTEVYETLRAPAERADILRLELLHRYGGVYVDADLECLRPIDDLLEGCDFVVGDLKPGRAQNAFIASVPGHPVLDEALRRLRPRRFHGYDKAGTGPLLLDEVLRGFPEVTRLAPAVLYPASPVDEETAYAIHGQERSWYSLDDARDLAQRADRRTAAMQRELYDVRRLLEPLEAIDDLATVRAGVASAIAMIRSDASVPPGTAAGGGERPRQDRRSVSRIEKAVRRRARDGAIAVYRAAMWPRRRTYATRLDRVPDRDELPEVLNRRGLLGTAVEVGVKKGAFSETILRRWRGRLLVSVDPWRADAPDRYVDRANVSQARHDQYYAQTRARLGRFGARSEIRRETSLDAAARFAAHSLDFVYIDARHDYASVRADLDAWYGRVRPGGLFAGHDYADGQFVQGDFGVKRAVDEFCAARGLTVYTTRGRWPIEMFASWMVEVPAG